MSQLVILVLWTGKKYTTSKYNARGRYQYLPLVMFGPFAVIYDIAFLFKALLAKFNLPSLLHLFPFLSMDTLHIEGTIEPE